MTDNLQVLAQTAYPLSAASPRVRVAQFEPFLSHHGISMRLQPALSEAEYALISSSTSWPRKAAVLARATVRASRRRPSEDELVLVQKLRFLAPAPGLDPPRRLDIYDFDDALYLRPDTTLNPRFRWAKQEARRCVSYLRSARVVIAGNEVLAAFARGYAKRVEVVPSCVDPVRQRVRVHADHDVIKVGWIGSRTTTPYLAPVVSALDALNREGRHLKLVLVGADRSLNASWIEHHPWSLATQERELAGFDIGIMPLPDTEWARGKCGYKVLQYFAAGIPAVASPVGIAAELVGGGRGIPARDADEWRAAIRALSADATERRDRGAEARRYVEQQFSYQHWTPVLASILRSVAGDVA